MTFIESFQKELEREAITTRKMLNLVPADKYNWKPHEKSMSLIQLATHVAEIPTWLSMVVNTTELDFAKNPYQPIIISKPQEMMSFFEKSLSDGQTALLNAKEVQLKDTWSMRNGEEIYFKDPKDEVIRMCFCQVVHHRAQLGVYLRLLNIPIPGSYGPSADEMGVS
jgi:uncharacterized damage-inducible protein DinB